MRQPLRAAALAAAAFLALPAAAQTNDASPFYAGGSIGLTHVSNLYRDTTGSSSDRVTSIGLLAGLDQRFGRQHLTFDGSLQDNRYADNSGLNNRSYSLRSALDWQTVEHLSGTFSAQSSRSLAQFNLGTGASPYREKNIERNQDYSGVVRLGMGSRYSLEGSLNRRKRDFSLPLVYDQLVYMQHTGGIGFYATPAGNLRLGLAARHTQGAYPRYPKYFFGFYAGTQWIDYQRNDFDFTTNWNTGGSSQLNTRISRSRTSYDPSALRDFHGTTGLVGWTWQPASKIVLNLQYARDSGQETLIQAPDVNRLYNSWQVNGRYAVTSKISLSAGGNRSRGHSAVDSTGTPSDSFDNASVYNVGVQWAFSRGLSLSCQANRSSRDTNNVQYTYSANSYGCTGQVLVY